MWNTFNEKFIARVIIISAILGLIFALILIRRTYRSWKALTERERTTQEDFKWFNRLCYGSMLCNLFVLVTIGFSAFPAYCDYTKGLWFSLWSLSRGFLVLFQIKRIQYAEKRSNSKKSGYPKWLFFILYASAIVSILYNLIVPRFTFIMNPIAGTFCIEQVRAVEFIEFQAGAIMLQVLLDVIIIVLYGRKFVRAMKTVRDDDSEIATRQDVVIRMKYILGKILFLVVVLTCCSIAQWSIYAIEIGPMVIRYQYFILNMVHIIGSIVCVIIAYLMIETHDNDYKAITNCKCCCCCKSENEANNEAAAVATSIQLTNTNTLKNNHDSVIIASQRSQT